MPHWGKSLLLPLLLIRESFDGFVSNWGNLEIFFFLKKELLLLLLLLFMTKLHVV